MKEYAQLSVLPGSKFLVQSEHARVEMTLSASALDSLPLPIRAAARAALKVSAERPIGTVIIEVETRGL